MAATLDIKGEDLVGAKEKVVIITGGSSGIGLATVELFSSLGAHVFVGDITSLPKFFPKTTFQKTDVSLWSDLLELFDVAFQAHGRVDIVLANAGIGEIADLFDPVLDDSGRPKEPNYKTLDVNLKGVVGCIKLAVFYMRKGGGGGVGVTGSVASYLGEGVPLYTATKHGVLGLVRSLASTLKNDNITINLVAPFFTDSALMYPSLRTFCTSRNIPVSRASSVAKALAYNALRGSEWTGKGVWVAADKWGEVEVGLEESREKCLGDEFDELRKRAWGKQEEEGKE
ncbi:NADP-binding protein [Dacryopinax primogenitus]|uniref:NADP-binding protein n=1 Tax=Dacryopinax primogenitus (strain DJM 731) TaxID=1858805 RepID=M5G090_DACPD|nr:NADP-binding protein [Dacryopinax primogenitus]EJT99236.1 NADP-binding protein [Dacryopinax primogenitus]